MWDIQPTFFFSKKWYNFISLTISNNIINNKLFEHWLKINNDNNNKSFIENYNNQNQYDKNKIVFKNKNEKQNKISFNKEFSIIKIKESIINDYFKFNLFLDNITVDDFKEIKNKFEKNQLLYYRIVVNGETGNIGNIEGFSDDSILFTIHEYISNENWEIISNLFKILELNYDFWLPEGYSPDSEQEDDDEDDGTDKRCTELYFNNLSIDGYIGSKNIFFDGSKDDCSQSRVNYSALFDPNNSGQQVESIKVQSKTYEINEEDFVEPLHLIKVYQFENLHSITVTINSLLILSNISEEMGFKGFYNVNSYSGFLRNTKSEVFQMTNSFITSKSLKNLKISSVTYEHYPLDYMGFFAYRQYSFNDIVIFAKRVIEIIEYLSNSFKPLFSELNTSIERIEFDCMDLLNINTFSNLLNNKSIKYLYLHGDSDFIVYCPKLVSRSMGLNQEPITINQYLFEYIFTSPLTSIRHYKIKFKGSNELKLIFNLIFNNIFKLQLYSLIFEFNKNELIGEFAKEFKNLINNISIQQLLQQKSNDLNLKEIKIKIKIKQTENKINYDENIQELNNINNPHFTTIIKKIEK
ncbi:hypothetical protein DDB_G0271392 [Dictyostelium discoideum AX4]|uniref:Uncharacterized protein n=1 Tax=Dictyostelium discoideum TaxID=44689 RepID=Q55BB4_DICDI|nr:hypothetical protein DDB_G0271392 [Dictyostelium discoideum AX4]EAL71826.1 hypothetical protein DDB_G0271392 [Dictyostelium discoideum AX4]|eukprot:XP_645698.1 hypothetical protein DDB_G0271392 [Dictyostelium discoideum AX4]